MYRLEQRIQQEIAAQGMVGLALAIVQGREVSYARGFGVTSVEDGGIPVTPHTLFAIGSISKTLTATLVMRLVEQGKLDLDLPVVTYLPDFHFSDVELGKRVTLRHVLSHTTGLPAGGKDFGPRDPDALRRFVWDELSRYPFVAPPGKIHLYSNTVIVLAGYLAEVVTGTYYDRLMEELIFEPLGMQRSTFDRTVAMTYPLALPHQSGEDGEVRARHRFPDNVSGNPAGFGLSSTLDLANFAIMHLNAGKFGEAQLLRPEAVALMQTPQASRYSLGPESGYGLAWYTGERKGVRQVGHGGMLQSYNCYLNLFPDHGFAVVLQCNYESEGQTWALVNDLYDQLLPAQATYSKPEPVAPDRTLWPQYVGDYLSLQSGPARVSVADDALMLQRNGVATPLKAVGEGLYEADGAPVGFVLEADGQTQYLVMYGEPYQRYEPDPAFVPEPDTWSGYTGTYVRWEIDPDPIQIRIMDSQLYMLWWAGEAPCEPLSNTSFVSTYGLIELKVPVDGGAPTLIVGKASRCYRITADH